MTTRQVRKEDGQALPSAVLSLSGGPIVGDVLGAFSSTTITIGLRRTDGGEFEEPDSSSVATGF